jgi:fatty-acyl-CoA synthase
MLLRHPAVAAAAAVGQPDGYAGEVPVAYVVLKPGAAVTAEDLMSFAERETAERPALPKAIRVMDALPPTAVGKAICRACGWTP